MHFESFLALYAILIGLALGSFLNVCIYRLPLKKSIISPSSSCPRCGARLRAYENIPIVSFVLLRGRCRHCKNPISWRYPVVEALIGLLSLALFTRYGFSYQYILFLLFVCLLVTVSFVDLDHQIIPDKLSFTGIALGLAAAVLTGHIAWHDSLIGIAAGYCALFLVEKGYKFITGKEGMGRGDAKMLAMIGAWLGWRALAFVVLVSSLAGALIGSVSLLLAGKALGVRIPFGPFLSMGALIYLFFGRQLTAWYLGLLY